MENLSPMLQQYLSMKQEVGQDTLLFFRLGDFYELFFEDAKIVSSELELILTSRAAGNNQKAPMCGVPHHAAHSYIQRLISKGYKVAIAQQMEDPALAKGLVKREVTKIITQGTNFDHDENETPFLASLNSDLFNFYLTLYDITSNQMKQVVTEKDYAELLTVLSQHHVKEVLINPSVEKKWLEDNTTLSLTEFRSKKNIKNPQEETKQRLLDYLTFTQKQKINPHTLKERSDRMGLDYISLLNLELLEVSRPNSKSYSLFSYLNKTKTSMGTRELKEWIKYPLLIKEDILNRQNQITFLVKNFLINHQLSELLKEVYDISRISTKIEYQSNNAQDLVRLKNTLYTFEKIHDVLGQEFLSAFDYQETSDIAKLIEDKLVSNPPALIGNDPTIKDGVDEKLDEYRSLLKGSNTWLLNYEQRLKEETGIKNLKVGYSKQFGYYLEVSKGQINQVKDEFGFMRRQTLTNAERYLTLELKNQEEKISSASSQIENIETKLLNALSLELKESIERIREVGLVIAQLDVLSALSTISSQPGFIKPEFSDNREIELLESIHPILEFSTKSHKIISNDFVMDEDHDIMIITGPNMGGKSTYMRQIAISVIMAQMGMYIKASKAKLPIFDAIYTRMGASDDIMSGHSTFMIEMIEANTAITKATSSSLVLFDEIGRGTSTFDGMAIAGSILEYLASKIKARTLFSTHYHQLTALSEMYPNIVNYQVMVEKKNQNITFLYQVKEGTANRSYGVHVAALADLPDEIIQKANKRLKEYQSDPQFNMTIEDEIEIVPSRLESRLNQLNVNELTPIQALQVLEELKELSKEDD